MKKIREYKILYLVLAGLMIVSSVGVVNAKEVDKNIITTYNEYLEVTKNLNIENEKDLMLLEDINKNTTFQVKEKYRKDLVSDVNSVLEQGISLPEDKDYDKRSVDLPNGNKLIIEMRDVSEESKITTLATDTSHEVHYNGYKEYGDRKYETTIYVHSLVDGRLVLSTHNHYTISSAGLKVRKADGGVPIVTSPTLRLAKGWYQKITDQYAEKVGYDTNVEGYARAYVVDGYQIPTGKDYSLKADVRVKLEVLDKTNKRAKVKQHIYATMKY